MIRYTILVLNFAFSVYGQTPYQQKKLLDLSEEHLIRSRSQKVQADSMARSKNWPIVGQLASGEEYWLKKLAVNGMPIYYCTENLVSAVSISTDHVWPGGESQLFLNGSGMIVGEWDTGRVLIEHQELEGRAFQIDEYPDLSDHATHVAGTMIAEGVNQQAHGMSNNAILYANGWDNDDSEMAAAAADGLILSNHSYGTRGGWHWDSFSDEMWVWGGDTDVDPTEDYHFGFYDEQSRQWDEIAYNAPHYLIVLSAGNDRNDGPDPGTEHWVWSSMDNDWVLSTDARNNDGPWDCISYHKISKNVLTVGAVNDISDGYNGANSVNISSFSSVGPVDDGRIKPDIVANGVGLFSSVSSSIEAYDSYSGTSMAAPSVTGSLILVQQWYQERQDTLMQAATLKALAIHAADEAGEHDGPDYRYGWGLMNTSRAIDIISQLGNGHLIHETVLSDGDSIDIQVSSSGSHPLRATISWTDIPGIPTAPSVNPPDIMLVNDLDLRIIHESGTIYDPYKLNPYYPDNQAITGDNIVDNVEQVHVANPEPGSYSIRITHKGSIGIGQPIGIIVSYDVPGNRMIHVGSNGDDLAGDGSEENPLASIQAAIDLSLSGDTVLVHPGTYNESIQIVSMGILLASEFLFNDENSDIGSTNIVGMAGQPSVRLDEAGYSTRIVGLTISHSDNEQGPGIHCVSSFPTIENCRIMNNFTNSNGGGVYTQESNVTFIGTEIYMNTASVGAGIYAVGSNIELDKVLLADNHSTLDGAALYMMQTDLYLDHVTITENVAGDDAGAIYLRYGSNVSVMNSILWNNVPQEIVFSPVGGENFIEIYFSDLYGSISGIETNNNGNTTFGLTNVIDHDPMFCLLDSIDFSLDSGSPCVGTGENGSDMGAYGIGCELVGIMDNSDQAEEQFMLYPAFPNPFNPLVRIELNIPNIPANNIMVHIMDIKGRNIATLLDEKGISGYRSLVWDGRGDNGTPVPAGLYFVRASTVSIIKVQKILLLK